MPERFICNGMLGKLCRLLRICGIDTAYWNQGLTILTEARKEGRVILTRNTRLRDKEGVFFIDATVPNRQLLAVLDKYHLYAAVEPLSRCLVCNERLQVVDKESIKNRIPYFTYKNFHEFAQCPNCQRVYWKGSHYQHMSEWLRRLGRRSEDAS